MCSRARWATALFLGVLLLIAGSALLVQRSEQQSEEAGRAHRLFLPVDFWKVLSDEDRTELETAIREAIAEGENRVSSLASHPPPDTVILFKREKRWGRLLLVRNAEDAQVFTYRSEKSPTDDVIAWSLLESERISFLPWAAAEDIPGWPYMPKREMIIDMEPESAEDVDAKGWTLTVLPMGGAAVAFSFPADGAGSVIPLKVFWGHDTSNGGEPSCAELIRKMENGWSF